MKSPLGIAPLPVQRTHEDSQLSLMEREGFLDEAVVATFCAAPAARRTIYPEDLALCSDDLDFAGWQSVEFSTPRVAEPVAQPLAFSVRRASPPVAGDQDTATSPPVTYRWWMAGLAGVIFALLLAALLIGLTSHRSMEEWKDLFSTQTVESAAAADSPGRTPLGQSGKPGASHP